MAEATFRHGDPVMIDYTPSSGNVAAGDVILLGNLTGITCGIAHRDLENNVKSAIAGGGGVYEVINLNNAADYAKVYWDGSKATTVSTNNATFGFIVRDGGGGANSNCWVLHHPYV